MADDFDWGDWDAQAAEYLATNPDFSNYSWSPDTSFGNYLSPANYGALTDISSWLPEASAGSWDFSGTEDLSKYLSPERYDILTSVPPSNYYSGEDGGMSGLSVGKGGGLQYVVGEGRVDTPVKEVDGYVEGAPGLSPVAVWNPASGTVEYPDYSTFKVPTPDGGWQDMKFTKDAQGNISGYIDERSGRVVNLGKEGSTWDKMSKAVSDFFKPKFTPGQQAGQQGKPTSPAQDWLTTLGGLATVAQAVKGKDKPAVKARESTVKDLGPKFQAAKPVRTKYAEGGKVEGALQSVKRAAKSKLIRGKAGGQDDVVDIKAAPGEYVFDAEAVSALGDGNTDAGARKLDKMRQNIRKHKRSGGLSAIPPKAKSPEQYMRSK